jgi:hypothetical protein
LTGEVHVDFAGEAGVDIGGPKREFFTLASQQLFSPDYSLFEIVGDKFYWFTRSQFEAPEIYEALGAFLGLAVRNSVYLPIRFPKLFYKKLLGMPLTLVDLAELDESIASSVTKVLEYREEGNDVSDMGLTFAITLEEFGERSEVPFFDGGEQTDVTNLNLDDYVRQRTEYHLHGSVAAQFECFARGFRKCCDHPLFKCFTPDEFDLLVSGELTYDWEELRANATYRGYKKDAQIIKWFWEVFAEFSEDKKKQLLFFVTGNDRAPIGGLKNLKMRIDMSQNTAKLPKSHTCFFALVLPPYSSKDELRRKLDISLANSSGFGLK